MIAGARRIAVYVCGVFLIGAGLLGSALALVLHTFEEADR